MRNTAYFVKKPRRLKDLVRPHRIEDEAPYEIVKTVSLSRIDYENIATDMTVERAYIAQYAHLCGIRDGVWRCLLIQQKNTKTGILVMPEDQSRVGYAAYYGWAMPDFPQ